ncbi:MAG: single-stranded-DNA-specific exonuclease RecJ [bacterium]
MSTKWNLIPQPPDDFMACFPEQLPIITQLLWSRNIRTQSEIDEFLNPDYSQDIHDPFLFEEMNKACDIIFKAIKKKKKIVVHGDYDADGVCSAAILIKTIQMLGSTNVSVYIPHREDEGYGLNMNTVEQMAKEKIDLIITCDCGSSNVKEIKLAKKKGIKVIVTDHHTVPPKSPSADAIIHPKMPNETYPDKGLAGAGVAFKLAQGLLKKHNKKNDTLDNDQTHEGFEKWMLDLVALATVGDMVPLIGESRTLTRYGLVVLNKTQNVGLLELFKVASLCDENGQLKKQIDAQTIAFQIVPRLNAAGRMDHANTAFNLLMCEDQAQAKILAKQLNQNNLDRQRLTDQLFNEAKKQIEKTKQQNNAILFAYNENWPTGLLGLISGRLKDCYHKPAIAFAKTGEGINGSGRSIHEFDLINALQSMPEYFTKYGGHPQACGLTVADEKQFELFKTELLEKANKEIDFAELIPSLDIEMQVELEDVNWKLYDLLDKFQPFGVGNPEPKYVTKNLTVMSVNPVGQDQKHLRILVKHNSHKIRKTIGFGLGDCSRHPDDWKNNLKPNDKIDMVFTISINEWNGNRELQLTVEDICVSSLDG